MTVYFDKTRKRWRYHFERAGQRHTGYCLTKSGEAVKSRRAAEQAEALERALVSNGRARHTPGQITLAEVLADVQEPWVSQSYWPTRQRHIIETLNFFGPEAPLVAISEARIDDFKQHLLKSKIMHWTGGSGRKVTDAGGDEFWKESSRTHSPATVNRYLQVIRAVFRRAKKLRDPVTHERVLIEVPEITDLQEPKRKARPVPDDVLEYVMGVVPQHVREAAIGTLLFGFRRDEMFGLQIKDLDFEHAGVNLRAADVKDNEDEFLPGSPESMAYLRKLADQAKARGVRHLITWRRARRDKRLEKWEPIKRPKTAWATAMAKVEEKFGNRYRWHDIRAAFITHVAIEAGAVAAQKMARHSTFATTQGYVDVADPVKRAAAARASVRPALAFLVEKEGVG